MRKLFFYFLFLQLCFSNLNASPAYPDSVEFTQPDGSKITILLKGDEYLNCAETTDGYTIIFNAKGFYEYAELNKDGNLVCSGLIARNPEERTGEVKEYLSKSSKKLIFSKNQIAYSKGLRHALKSQALQKAFPTTGTRKLICILMDFSDKPFTKTQSDFNNLFNQVNYSADGAVGSVRDFYLQNSYNQLNLSITVVGPFRASQPMAYYGGSGGGDSRSLVNEAIQKADPYVNYADFDNDNNGYVDGIYMIFGGYGEEAGAPADAIWSHAWSISPVTLDGKIITSFACSPELRGNSGTGITRIGVICHEFGHVLGAPDYYDTNYSTDGQFAGTGSWDLMSGGNWNNSGITPAHHNGFTKTHIYNWATPTVLTSPAFLTLQSAHSNSNSFYEFTTTTPNEIYFCENRQNLGFDASIPGHGLIIYHVHKDIWNGGINVMHPQKMYPVCASATADPGFLPTSYGSINSGGTPFPGTSGKRSFTDFTIPGSKSWEGDNTGKPLTNITENTTDKTISFDFMGGTSGNPTNFKATALNSSSILLDWTIDTSYPDVLIAYNTSGIFGTPVDGNEYIAGNTITGGGIVVYKGSVDTFLHNSLSPGNKYYYKAWSVKPGNNYSSGVPVEIRTPCNGATLPFTENFNFGTLSVCWTIVKNDANVDWRISSTNNAGGSANELLCEVAVNNETTRIIVAPINTVGIYQLLLSFKHKFLKASGAALKLQSSTDKINWTDELWSVAVQSNDSIGPENVLTTINSNLNAPATYISFVLTSGSTAGTSNHQLWYLDNVSVTAPSDCTPPAAQLSNVSVTENTGKSVSLKCIRGNGSGVLILAKKGSEPVTTIPLLGTSYTADSIFGNGQQIEPGIFVVYSGNDSIATIAGLEPGETYSFALFEFDATGPCYKIPAVHYTVTTVNRTWTGAISDDWSTAGNWLLDIIPAVGEAVIIPGGCANYPVIDEQVACKRIQIQDGGKLTISTGADVLVEDSIKVGQGTSGTFIVNGGSCEIKGNYYTETASTTTISGGNFKIEGWGRRPQSGTLNYAMGTINLIGGTITSTNTVCFSTSGVNGTMSGDFVFNVYSTLYLNGTGFNNVDGGTINLLGDGGIFGSTSALVKAVAYNLNVDAGSGGKFLLCPPFTTKGTLVKGNLTVKSGTAVLTNGGYASNLEVIGNINIFSGATLNCDSIKDANLSVAGNWSNSGAFRAGSNIVTFNGVKQRITGATTFRGLTKNVTTSDTLTFTPGESSAITITGTMNLKGAAGQILALRSSTPGIQWQIDPQGNRSIAYLDVQDSYNINATGINAYATNSVDSGNNTNWNFLETNIKNLSNDENLNYKIFPNPAVDVLNIVCSDDVQKSLTIVNKEGKVLLEKTLSGKENKVDVSNLPSGAYFIKIMDSKEITVHKLLKI